ncbi:MAG: UDP-2,4-diacetamido-2,4,6-trideoxy-beta-L-altropyranose hydrolase [Halobacteriovoraceae bacterium]|nr:UDP-2,4-diacetamido-2,4,6-trideoxy-beta-L-altropyranose hydrolase [Halobacteriovoraceae bacterium]
MMNVSRVLFRVDAAWHIGLGHLLRCIELAKIIEKAGIEVFFVCRNFEGFSYEPYISNLNFKFFFLERVAVSGQIGEVPQHEWLGCSVEEDVREVICQIKDLNFNAVFVDHYSIDKRWEKKIKSKCRKVVVIDDLGDRQHSCDYIVDPNYASLESKFLGSGSEVIEKLLLGTKYTILKSDFPRLRESYLEKKTNSSLKKILVNLGGASNSIILKKILIGIEDSSFSGEVVVLANNEEFVKECESDIVFSKFTFIKYISDMADFYHDIDLVIGAAGTSFWERCCLGIPSILLKVADNQEVVIKPVEAKFPELVYRDSNALISSLDELFENFSDVKYKSEVVDYCSSLICGLGKWLIVKEVFNLSLFNLREANYNDCDVIYGWQLFPGVRKFFRNSDVPTYDEHCNWFSSSLVNENRKILIFEVESIPLGYLRLDYSDQRSAEVSIIISPFFKGNGLATIGLLQLSEDYSDLKLTAYIHVDNHASQKAFLKAGFKRDSETSYSLER